MSRNPRTVHEQASAPPSQQDRSRLAVIRSVRALPGYGVTPSTDDMLAAVDRIVSTGDGLKFEVDKLAQWMETFPLRSETEAVADWRGWPAVTVRAIAGYVMVSGLREVDVAGAYGTTPETVKDIVREARTAIRRGAHPRNPFGEEQ